MDPSVSREAKDLIQKILLERLGDNTLAWYGVDLPAIVAPLPSALPLFTIEKRDLDSVYRLADGTILDVEFQTNRLAHADLERFLDYATALITRYHTKVSLIVVHLKSTSAPDTFSFGSVTLRLNNVFIAQRDGQAVWDRLTRRASSAEAWEPTDYLDLAFVPFMDDPTTTPGERAVRAAQMASALPSPANRYATAMILGLTGTFVDPEMLNLLKEVIRMNRLIEELEAEAQQRGLDRGAETRLGTSADDANRDFDSETWTVAR